MTDSKEFTSGLVPPKTRMEPAWWFVFREDDLLIEPESSQTKVPCLLDVAELKFPILGEHYVGRLDGHHCYAVDVAKGTTAPEGMIFEGLRQIFGVMDEDLFLVAGRAAQIIHWDRTHQYCGRCGARTKIHSAERARKCPQCSLLHFPRLDPAIIVLVERGSEMLLARSRRFSTAMYSVLAGFVEPGETLEEAVIREVYEETGIGVKDIRYFWSQSWPFPHSLMIGFTATYASGEITMGDGENVDAGWFTADNLPSLPSKMSIARKLIDWFLEKQGKVDPSGSRSN